MVQASLPRWTVVVTVAVLAAASIGGTSLAADAAAPYSISGTVLGKATPSATPAPLANVAVYLGAVVNGTHDSSAAAVYTDSAGHFDFDDYAGLTAGTYDLWYNPCYLQTATPCDYEQYETGALTLSGADDTFTLSAGTPTAVKNVTLNKAGFVSGVLRDENGDPVTDAYVFADYPSGYYGQLYGAPTDANGAYNLKVRPGQVNISSNTTKHYNEPNETRDCYHPAFQGGATSSATATPLTIAVAQVKTGVDLAYSIAPSIRGQVVDASGTGIPWVGSVPFHLNEATGKFDGPRSGPFGTDGSGWWLSCPRPGESYKFVFSDSLNPGGLGDGATIDRTTPVVSGWAGGTSGMRINQAPSFGPVAEGEHVDAGKLTLVPFVEGSALFSLGTPRVVSDEGYPDELYVEEPGVSPGDASQTARQWFRNGVALAGETDYVLDIDSTQEQGTEYTARLTYSRQGSPDLVLTSSVYTVGGAQADETFDAVGTPTISGGSVVGDTLTATTGTWSPTPTFQYRWLRDGSPISGATASTYALTSSDVGKSVSVRVTGSKSGLVTASKDSTAVGPVTAVPPVVDPPVEPPVVDPPVVDPPVVNPPVVTPPVTQPGTLSGAVPLISGTKRVGQVLTANAGAWGPAPVALGFQWLRNGAPIGGATGASYTTVASDRGAVVSVVVTGTKAGYTSASTTSAGEAIAAGTIAVATPKVTGTVKVGKKLKVTQGPSTPAAVSTYRWYRSVGAKWKAIAGATKASYTVKSGDRGHKLRAQVTTKKSGYTTSVVNSKATVTAK